MLLGGKEITFSKISKKDETWWDDMERDAQEYLASLEESPEVNENDYD